MVHLVGGHTQRAVSGQRAQVNQNHVILIVGLFDRFNFGAGGGAVVRAQYSAQMIH